MGHAANKEDGFQSATADEEFKEEVFVYEEDADVKEVEPGFKINNGQTVYQASTKTTTQQTEEYPDDDV